VRTSGARPEALPTETFLPRSSRKAIEGVETPQANILELDTLPDLQTQYDLIVSVLDWTRARSPSLDIASVVRSTLAKLVREYG